MVFSIRYNGVLPINFKGFFHKRYFPPIVLLICFFLCISFATTSFLKQVICTSQSNPFHTIFYKLMKHTSTSFSTIVYAFIQRKSVLTLFCFFIMTFQKKETDLPSVLENQCKLLKYKKSLAGYMSDIL